MKRGQHRERDVPANRCCQETNRIVIASNHDLGASRWRAAGLAAARKDLDNNHAAAAARAWRAMTGGEIRIGCVLVLPAARHAALGWPAAAPWRVRYWPCSRHWPAAHSGR